MMHIWDICDVYHDDDAAAAAEVEMVAWQPLLRKLRNLGPNNYTLNFD